MPPSKGVGIKLGGRTRQLRYTTRALDRLEAETGLATPQIVQRVNIGAVRYSVWVLWAGLIHEDMELERDTVLDWLDELTPEEEKDVFEALSEALSEQSGQAEEDAEGKAVAAS